MTFSKKELEEIILDAFKDVEDSFRGDYDTLSVEETWKNTTRLEGTYKVLSLIEEGGYFTDSPSSKLKDIANKELIRYRDILYDYLCDKGFKEELDDWGYNSGKDLSDMKFIFKMGSHKLKEEIDSWYGDCYFNGELYFTVCVEYELPETLDKDAFIIKYSIEEYPHPIMEIPSSIINYKGLNEKELHDLLVDEIISVISKY